MAKKYKWSTMTKEDVQNFIFEHLLKSPGRIKTTEYAGLLNHIRHKLQMKNEDFEWIDFKKVEPIDYSLYDSVEKLQKYIDEHSDEIRTPKDFKTKTPHNRIYNYACSHHIGVSELKYEDYQSIDLSKYLDIESVLKYIDEHSDEIKTPKDFRTKSPHKKIYNFACSHHIGVSELKYEDYHVNDLSEYSDIKSIQKFIDEHSEITCPAEFKKRFYNIYDKAKRLKIAKDLVYSERRHIEYDWD